MTDKLMCSNCGAPVSRTGTDTSVACPHCQVVNEFPPVAGAHGTHRGTDRERDRDRDDQDDERGNRVPSIVIIQAPSVPQQPRIIQTGPIFVRRQRSLVSILLGPIFFVIVFIAVGAFIRARAARVAAEIPAAEKAAERAEKGAEKAAEKPPEHKKH